MELRQPPATERRKAADPWVRGLLLLNCALLVGLGALLLLRGSGPDAAGVDLDRMREVAGKLQAAGALGESAGLYEAYLESADEPAADRARFAFSLAQSYLEQGAHERALRWLYEAESLGAGELTDEVEQQIVATLERLGRTHAAQAALDRRVRLDDPQEPARRGADDPVVARIGDEEIRRSQVERALDGLPQEMAARMRSPEARTELLRKYVADELIWRKARKLGYDRLPEVQRQVDLAAKQLAVGHFVDQEVVRKISVDPADLANFFAAHRQRYQGEDGAEVELDAVRPQVERDYRMSKVQSAYAGLIESELSAAEVELFAERMVDGP